MAGLSARLVALVRDLQQEQQQALTVERVTAEAVAWAGADAVASISIVRRRAKRIETIGATSETVIRGDALQYELGQGPCLAAIWDQAQVYSADLASDERWPAWAPRVAQELDVHSMLCTRLFTREDTLGALNIYSAHRDAFDEETREEIWAFAAHAAVAVAHAQHIEQLTVAVDRRARIGTAMGIIMERFDVDEDQALSLLKRLSSHANRKLHDVAAEIVMDRTIPG